MWGKSVMGSTVSFESSGQAIQHCPPRLQHWLSHYVTYMYILYIATKRFNLTPKFCCSTGSQYRLNNELTRQNHINTIKVR